MLRLIQIGVGGFGWYWLGTALKAKGYEVVALVDTNRDALKRGQEASGLPDDHLFASLNDALKAVEADVLLNVTPAAFHRKTTEQALRAGLHVLVEKPMAETLSDGRAMVRAAGKAGRLLMVTQQYRYQPEPRAIRAAIESERIGELDHILIEFQMPVQVQGWRKQMEHPFLIDMSIHHFDLIRYLVGANAEQVYALAWNPKVSSARSAMNAMVVFQMENGVKVNYAGGWAVPGRTTRWNGAWVFTGSRGSMVWDENGIAVCRHDLPAGRFASALPEAKPLKPKAMSLAGSDYNLKLLAQCIANGETPETSGRDNLGTLAMVFSAVRSAETGKPVKIPAS